MCVVIKYGVFAAVVGGAICWRCEVRFTVEELSD